MYVSFGASCYDTVCVVMSCMQGCHVMRLSSRMIFTIVAGALFSASGYYLVFLWCSFSLAFFLVRTLARLSACLFLRTSFVLFVCVCVMDSRTCTLSLWLTGALIKDGHNSSQQRWRWWLLARRRRRRQQAETVHAACSRLLTASLHLVAHALHRLSLAAAHVHFVHHCTCLDIAPRSHRDVVKPTNQARVTSSSRRFKREWRRQADESSAGDVRSSFDIVVCWRFSRN